jgi:hypothetical protein
VTVTVARSGRLPAGLCTPHALSVEGTLLFRVSASWTVARACAPRTGRPVPAGAGEGHCRMLTARATTSTTVTSETVDWSIISILAQRDNGITSVGLNAVELVNERYR